MSEALKTHIQKIGQELEELAKFTKKSFTPAVKRVYIQFLVPLSPEEFDRAIKTWLFKSTSFPSVESLLECCGRSPGQRAERIWVTLEVERDKIADEICREEKILISLRTLQNGNEYSSGLARRDLQKRFVELYKTAWLEWWVRGEIVQGETLMDFRPKVNIPKPVPEDQRLTPEQFKFLNSKINKLYGHQIPQKPDPEELKKLDQATQRPLTPEEISDAAEEWNDDEELEF